MADLRTESEHPPPRLRPGELIGDRYRLEGIAGAGGMAIVWRATDERLQRPVAVKVMSDALAANPAAVARFAREARTHAGIQHPNLVRVYDYSVELAQPYLVMEYIDGATLSERMDSGRFTPAEARTLALELLSAIACVHDNNVLHRDIKSANVLLDRDGRARLTDFGLARLEDATRITRPNEVVGTLRYLAPELLEGEAATRQSDLFALGVLLRNVSERSEPQPELGELVDWMTRRSRDERPSNAHVLLAALGRSAVPAPPAAVASRDWETISHPVEEDPTLVTLQAEDPTLVTPQAEDPTLVQPAAEEPTAVKQTAARPTRANFRSRRLRSRILAVTALAAAASGTALVIDSVEGGAARPARSSTGRRARPLTIDQQLQRLAGSVRRAAAP